MAPPLMSASLQERRVEGDFCESVCIENVCDVNDVLNVDEVLFFPFVFPPPKHK